MSIRIRKRKLSAGTVSLYLDTYHKGSRKTESLGLQLGPDKDENGRILELANKIRARRELELQNELHGFTGYKLDTNFFTYSKAFYLAKPETSQAVYRHVTKYLKIFTNQSLTFRSITPRFCESFRDYLYSGLKPGTALAYFGGFKSVLLSAVQDNILLRNPTHGIKLKRPESYPRYLTLEEVSRLIQTKLRNEAVRNAFLFSCWTGLRFSDISRITWDQVQDHVIAFRQKKTGNDNLIPLCRVAIEILERQKARLPGVVPVELPTQTTGIFHLPVIQNVNSMLKRWAKRAGVEKNISFHVARHTFATLAISSGVDIYTTSKLLGHKSISTTTVYAKIIDEKRREAVTRLPTVQL